MVAIYLPTLKHWLIIDLAMEPFCEFHISTQTTAKLELNNALITQGFEARTTLLKICVCLMASLTISEVMDWLVFSVKLERSKIFKYNFDLGSHKFLICSELIFSESLMYFSIIFIS